MGSDWDGFISRCQKALGELVEGRPEPFKAPCSHADDVVIMGAFGGSEMRARLEGFSLGTYLLDGPDLSIEEGPRGCVSSSRCGANSRLRHAKLAAHDGILRL